MDQFYDTGADAAPLALALSRTGAELSGGGRRTDAYYRPPTCTAAPRDLTEWLAIRYEPLPVLCHVRWLPGQPYEIAETTVDSGRAARDFLTWLGASHVRDITVRYEEWTALGGDITVTLEHVDDRWTTKLTAPSLLRPPPAATFARAEQCLGDPLGPRLAAPRRITDFLPAGSPERAKGST
ncbi:hypothetical protein AB0G74_30645 [Streptomyces sp. NPDC020875]|uniref:hypothetical protein n=1 Tax=Streptomyces sp. NPDC020875 TaxID=3154898 RepID=UPI0033F08988